jgi:hypothetical protein
MIDTRVSCRAACSRVPIATSGSWKKLGWRRSSCATGSRRAVCRAGEKRMNHHPFSHQPSMPAQFVYSWNS